VRRRREATLDLVITTICFICHLIRCIGRTLIPASKENGKRQIRRVKTIEFGREATQGLVTTTISFIRRLIRRIRRKTRQASEENGKRQGSRVETIEFGREATQGLVTTTISFILRLIRRIRRKTRQASQENGKRQGRRVDTIEFGTITVGKEGKIGKGSAAWKQICDVSVFGSSTVGSQEETHGYSIVEFPSSWGGTSSLFPFVLLVALGKSGKSVTLISCWHFK